MSLVVDACVAIKWFIDENHRDQALAILDLQVPLIAPDLFKAEFTNVLWKKIRRSEISSDAAQILIDRVDSFVSCIATSSETARHALHYATVLNHSSYDCLYLALAEQAGTKLVTADDKFATKLCQCGLSHLVMRLSDSASNTTSTVVSSDDLQRLLALSARYEATVESVHRQLKPSDEAVSYVNTRDLGPAWDSPSARRLERALADLSEDHLTDLAALAWLGRGYDGKDFSGLKRHALTTFSDGPSRHLSYIASLLRYVEQGLRLLPRQGK